MEYSQGSYSHEEYIRGLHVSMGNVEMEYNGRRDKHEPATMRSLQREVQRYRSDNENIMKAREEILQRLNFFHKQVEKYYGTIKEASARKVEVSGLHDRMDDHGGFRESRSASTNQHHHSLGKLTRITYACSSSEIIPSVSMLDIRGRYMVHIACKGILGISSHHHLMERKIKEKMQKHG
jgi:hypothetical protein